MSDQTPAQRNARYQREYRARNAATYGLQRAMARITEGKVPQRATMERYGITPEQVNRVRTENGMETVDFGLFPVTCRKPECVQVKPNAADRKAPEPEAVPAPSTALLRKRKRSSAKGMKLDEIVGKISALKGETKLDKTGQPVRKAGVVQKIEDSTVKQMRDKFGLIARTIGCATEDDDIVACLRDTDKAVAKMRDRWPKDVSFKTAAGNIVSLSKYIPGFGEALGAAPLKVYRDLMMGNIKSSTEEAVARTETRTVTPIGKIRTAVRAVANKYGKTSPEAIATNLQTNLDGLRDNISGVAIVKTPRDAEFRDIKNYYVPSTKRLYVSKFKTSKEFPPYDFTLNDTIANTIAKSLKDNPREYLVAKTGVGRLVKKAFEEVGLPGVGVNEIRHSQITDLLKKKQGEAHVNHVARLFKHSPTMTLRYVRGENPNDA